MKYKYFKDLTELTPNSSRPSAEIIAYRVVCLAFPAKILYYGVVQYNLPNSEVEVFL